MNIKFDYKDTTYTLEFSKQAVRTLEGQGFSIDAMGERPATMIPLLFKGAFIKWHRGIKTKLVDEMYAALANKTELITALAELYMDTVNSVLEGADENLEDEIKKVKWVKSE